MDRETAADTGGDMADETIELLMLLSSVRIVWNDL